MRRIKVFWLGVRDSYDDLTPDSVLDNWRDSGCSSTLKGQPSQLTFGCEKENNTHAHESPIPCLHKLGWWPVRCTCRRRLPVPGHIQYLLIRATFEAKELKITPHPCSQHNCSGLYQQEGLCLGCSTRHTCVRSSPGKYIFIETIQQMVNR